jgi:hypothetical protein
VAVRTSTPWILGLAIGFTSVAHAIDHSNVDEGRPLLFEDAYPIAQGEFALESGGAFVHERRAPDRGVADIQLLYGALPNFHVGIGTFLSSDPYSIDEPTRSGDLAVGALYNFNQETLWWPALATQVRLNVPTGVDSAGVDTEVTGIVTKSLGRTGIHANASYERVGGTEDEEREHLYEVVLGTTYPLGAPMNTRLTLLADVFTRRSTLQGDDNVTGIEGGVRYQLTHRLVLDAGIGSELAGPSERSPVYVRAGFSVGF